MQFIRPMIRWGAASQES